MIKTMKIVPLQSQDVSTCSNIKSSYCTSTSINYIFCSRDNNILIIVYRVYKYKLCTQLSTS